MNIRKDLFNHQDTKGAKETLIVKSILGFGFKNNESFLQKSYRSFDLLCALCALGGSKELAFGGLQ